MVVLLRHISAASGAHHERKNIDRQWMFPCLAPSTISPSSMSDTGFFVRILLLLRAGNVHQPTMELRVVSNTTRSVVDKGMFRIHTYKQHEQVCIPYDYLTLTKGSFNMLTNAPHTPTAFDTVSILTVLNLCSQIFHCFNAPIARSTCIRRFATSLV